MPMNDAQKIMSSASTGNEITEGKLCRCQLGEGLICFSLLGKAESLSNVRLRSRNVTKRWREDRRCRGGASDGFHGNS
jgi:hypothetical protein